MSRERVMIAGIGGASLGTEIAKCLRLVDRYDVFGCDVSPTAFGLYCPHFDRTFHVDRSRYLDSVIEACQAVGARWLIPGGEQPMVLLSAGADRLTAAGLCLAANDPAVVRVFSEKRETFEKLRQLGFAVPRTVSALDDDAIASVGLPCIVKPAADSGGSVFVFLSQTLDEAKVYIRFLQGNGYRPLVQEYVDVKEGEFTIGVLSLPDTTVVGSIALRRSLDAKLSVAYRGKGGIISSGYSQGYIGDFPELRRTAEAIAKAIGSRGPINVQGRVRDGRLLPFEINPRFSASTYLRALAGFNEPDMFLRHLAGGERPEAPAVRHGWYLRSLTETFVPEEGLKK